MPVVRLEGLPFRITPKELLDFLSGCDVKDGEQGIHLVSSSSGLATGTGYAELSSEDGRMAAVDLSEKNIGQYNRYAVITACDEAELEWYRNRKERSGKRNVRVRMRGVPFRASAFEIAKWFDEHATCVDVDIHVNNNGRPSGSATAYFESKEEAEKAMALDKESMSGRYIDLVLDTSVTKGHLVRMSGVPFSATVEEMIDFFKPEAECSNVRIIYNHDGRPSGTAVAEFESEEMADKALRRNREHLGTRFVVLTREYDDNLGEENNRYFYSRSRPNNSHNNSYNNHYNNSYNSYNNGGGQGFDIRLRGLPYRATSEEIAEWFSDRAECIAVKLLLNNDGRPSGEAIASFSSVEEANSAMNKHKEYLGERFVLLQALY